MAAKNKEPSRPRLRVVVFLGALTAMLGAFLGVVSLATQAPVEVRSAPKEADRVPGEVYFIKGSSASTAAWRGKQSQLVRNAPGAVRVTEQELNAWAQAVFTGSQRRGGLREETPSSPKPKVLGLEVTIASINFRLIEDQLQMAAEFSVPALSSDRSFLYQVVGRLEVKDGGGISFEPDTGYLGKAALVRVPVLGKLIHGRLMASFYASPEGEALEPALARVTAVTIAPGLMTLQIP